MWLTASRPAVHEPRGLSHDSARPGRRRHRWRWATSHGPRRPPRPPAPASGRFGRASRRPPPERSGSAMSITARTSAAEPRAMFRWWRPDFPRRAWPTAMFRGTEQAARVLRLGQALGKRLLPDPAGHLEGPQGDRVYCSAVAQRSGLDGCGSRFVARQVVDRWVGVDGSAAGVGSARLRLASLRSIPRGARPRTATTTSAPTVVEECPPMASPLRVHSPRAAVASPSRSPTAHPPGEMCP